MPETKENEKELKKCVVLEMIDRKTFETQMNEYLFLGYKVASSSCNSKLYKAVLVLEPEENILDKAIRKLLAPEKVTDIDVDILQDEKKAQLNTNVIKLSLEIPNQDFQSYQPVKLNRRFSV